MRKQASLCRSIQKVSENKICTSESQEPGNFLDVLGVRGKAGSGLQRREGGQSSAQVLAELSRSEGRRGGVSR